MAEVVVTYLIDKLSNFLAQEKVLHEGVHGEIKFIKDELESMTAFVRAVDARKDSDEVIKVWVKQLRDVAHDIEDILDESILVGISQNHQLSYGPLKKIKCFMKSMKERRSLAIEIQEIKKQVLQISDRSKRYVFGNVGQDQHQGSSGSNPWHDLREDAVLLDDADLVGIKGPKEDLIELLVKGESKLSVVSIVGMGGLGKTTLAKKVYDDPKIKKHFQSLVWISVSQIFNVEVIFKDIIQQIYQEVGVQYTHQERIKTIKDMTALKTIVHMFLKTKSYVIVFDDIWSIHAWDAVKIALPDNQCGSRVLITTRFSNIASYCTKSYGHIYNLAALPPNESWTLFCRKAFGRSSYGSEFEELSKEMLSKCAGLPLGIVSIAGLLSTKGSNYMEWEIICHSLGVEIENNDMLESMKKILMLSFTDLPYNLKACFMYIGLFPERHPVKCRRLIRLWIAEGFITDREGRTIEEVAESHLNELIDRNLLQVAVRDRCGRIKRCQVHDLMHEIILSRSLEAQFGAVVSDRNKKLTGKFRHLFVENSGDCNNSFYHRRIRSLFLSRISKSAHSNTLNKFLAGFRLLRVVDLKGEPLESFPTELLNLFHLRYLGMRRTNIKKLPNGIGKLQNLETLDLKHTNVSKLPVGILKLQKLRYLFVHHFNFEQASPLNFLEGFTPIIGISSLNALQKLSFIKVNQGCRIIEELGKMSQLRRLGIIELREEDGSDMCSSLENMRNLRSLSVSSGPENDFLDLESLSNPPPLLERLVMSGPLAKFPSWITSLRHLVRIRLRYTHLSNSPLEALQDLPNLVELELFQAFVGDLLCFEEGGFPKLISLNLKHLKGLKKVEFKKGAVLQLENLYILRCKKLQNVPFGIEHLTNLKDLRFYDMSDELMRQVQCEDEEDRKRINHIPGIHAFFWKDSWEYLKIIGTIPNIPEPICTVPVTPMTNIDVRHFEHYQRIL